MSVNKEQLEQFIKWFASFPEHPWRESSKGFDWCDEVYENLTDLYKTANDGVAYNSCTVTVNPDVPIDIASIFVWDETPQRHTYWNEVSNYCHTVPSWRERMHRFIYGTTTPTPTSPSKPPFIKMEFVI